MITFATVHPVKFSKIVEKQGVNRLCCLNDSIGKFWGSDRILRVKMVV